MLDLTNSKKVWKIRRYASEEDFKAGKTSEVKDPEGNALPAESEFHQNLLLNEGKQALHNLLTGAAETAFSNANSYLGVGDDATAESASQTGLQAASNKLYKAMEATYPSFATDTTTWQSVFASGDANFAWNEFTVANGNSDASDNLNRKVSAQGTKASGQVWTLDLSIQWT